MNKPILIDLYCCAGGATKGYQRAGFYVIGVDRDPQPNYCGDAFVQMDALEFLATLAADGSVLMHEPWRGRLNLNGIAAFHGSPPCQKHTALTKGNERRGWTNDHIDLIPETRDFFEWFGLPYVIENVQGSPLRRDLVLCGLKHFGLKVFRHRYFELGGWSMSPITCDGRGDHAGHRVAGWRHGVKYDGDMVAVYGDGGGKGSIAEWESALGIEWVTRGSMKDRKRTLAEAIPPAYTEHIGRELREFIG